MANSFGLLCFAVVIAFVAARLLKDAKAFSKYMAILLISLLVGAGIKVALSENTETPEKTVVIPTDSVPMHNTTPFVVEIVDANLDCAGEGITERDSVEIEAGGLPTTRQECAFIDDS